MTILNMLRFIGLHASLVAMLMYCISSLFLTQYVTFTGGQGGLFNYCLKEGNKFRNLTSEVCDSLGMDIPGSLHVVRAVTIINVIFFVSVTFCSPYYRLEPEGKTFKDKHSPDMTLLCAAILGLFGLKIFEHNFKDVYVYEDGSLDTGWLASLIGMLMLFVSALFNMTPTLHQHCWVERCGKGPATTTNAARPPARSISVVSRSSNRRGSTTRVGRNEQNTNSNSVTRSESMPDISIITDNTSYPSSHDISLQGSFRNIYVQGNSSNPQNIMVLPPSYDSLTEVVLTPPPEYDNLPDALPPSYEDSVLYPNNKSDTDRSSSSGS